MQKIAIIGTTSWGITLSLLLASKGADVRLWARTKREANKIRKKGSDRFPDITIPEEEEVGRARPIQLLERNHTADARLEIAVARKIDPLELEYPLDEAGAIERLGRRPPPEVRDGDELPRPLDEAGPVRSIDVRIFEILFSYKAFFFNR